MGKKYVILLLISVPGICTNAFCQFKLDAYEFGLHTGSFVYQGDLTPHKAGSFKTLHMHGGLSVARILSPAVLVRLHYTGGRLLGKDAKYTDAMWRMQRNFRAETKVRELALTMIYDLRRMNTRWKEGSLRPYLFAGVGASRLRTDRNWSGLNTEFFASSPTFLEGLGRDTTATLPSIIFTVPVGAGVRYHVSKAVTMYAEAAYRYSANDDYLDGYKYAGNPGKGDQYYGISLGLIVSPGARSAYKCPMVRP